MKTLTRGLLLLTLILLAVLPVAAQEADTLDFETEGISFTYPPDLASDFEIVAVDAVLLDHPDMPYWAANPAYTQIIFLDYLGEETVFFHFPRLEVYALDDLSQYGGDPEFSWEGQTAALQTLLEEEPDLSEYIGEPTTSREVWLPFLPLFNAAQVFRIQPEYLEFENGRGIRYLTYYSQAASPITDDQIIYTFQGITDDGQHYVSAVFPLRTGLLPEDIDFDTFDFDAFAEGYMDYLNETIAALEAQPAEDFTPSLDALDALIMSLKVE